MFSHPGFIAPAFFAAFLYRRVTACGSRAARV
jgi:hypothetical protein